MSEKFKAALEARIKAVKDANKKVVKVGIVEHQHYDNGIPVAYIASIHEYGGIFTVPARQATIYRQIDKNGEWTQKNGSRFVSKKKSNFATEVTIPAHTITIKPRPFFRPAFSNNRKKWRKEISNLLKQGHSVEEALELVGSVAAGDVFKALSQVETPKLAESTIKAKERRYKSKSAHRPDKPLFASGLLSESISYVIEDKE